MNTTKATLSPFTRSNLSHLVGSKIGTVTINAKHSLKHTRTYEVAAWNTQLESVAGTYDLIVGWNEYDAHQHLTVYAKLAATVQDDNCAPLFGGVAFAPARKDRVGTRDEFSQTWDALHTLREANNRFADHIQFTIDPDNAQVGELFNYALSEAETALAYFLAHTQEALTAGHAKAGEFMAYSMVAHYAQLADSMHNSVHYARLPGALVQSLAVAA